MAPDRRISVVLPVYNESENIAPCLRGLWGALRGVEHEILVCYDFDEDTTLPAIRAMGDAPPTVKLIKNTIGRGAANALKAGFAAATGDVVVTSMADLSDPPAAIIPMAEKIRAGAAVVSGSRYMRGGSQTGGPLVKRVFSHTACLLLRWVAGLGTHDATTNFKAYSKEFLARTQVESTTAFDIALELTVKAHLAGERVDEVPSSWVDRSHGASRFRVWAWAPHYLRWWGRAMAAPLCVWLAWLGLTLWSALSASASDRGIVLALSAVGLLAILLARVSRRRMRLVDAAHAVLWCHSLHAWLLDGLLGIFDLVVTPAASLAVLFASVPNARLRATFASAPRRAKAFATPRNLAALAFGVVLWLARFSAPKLSNSLGLDDSWRDALSYFHARGFRAGVDYVFTYGPLGFMDVGQFRAEQFWTRIAVWECGVEIAFACVFALRFAQLSSWFQRVLFAVTSCLAASNSDAYLPLVAVLVTVEWLRADPRTASPFVASSALLAIVALVKFSYFVLAAGCIAIVIGVLVARRRFVGAALVVCSSFVALLVTWLLSGQHLDNVFAFVSTSLEMAGGYVNGMSLPAPPNALAIGVATLGLVFVNAVLHAFGRAATLERRASAAVVAVGALLAYKSSFVRFDRDGSLALFASVAVLALDAAGVVRSRVWSGAVWITRLACLSIALLGTRAGNDRGWRGVSELPGATISSCANALHSLGDLPAAKAALERRVATQRDNFALPNLRAVVGSTPCDLLGVNQALLLRAGLEYRPQPVFQPYAAYTPRLAELNARYLESASAPKYVLMRLEGIDGHLPTLDDGPALQITLRDYRPELVELGFMLWSRKSDAERKTPSARPVVLDRTANLGEWIELDALAGTCHVATIDVELSSRGRALEAAYQADALVLQVRSDQGEVQASRAPASMLGIPFIIDPMINDHFAMVRWVAGQRVGRARAIRLIEYTGEEGSFAPKFKLRLERADELAAPPPPDAERRFVYSMFDTKPDWVRTTTPTTSTIMFNREALMVYAPSEMSFTVPAGKHVLRGLYGLGPNAVAGGVSDGVTFSVALAGAAKPLFERHLDPVRVPAERGMEPLRVEFENEQPTQLFLRTNPGPRNDTTDDCACWSGIRIEDAAKKP